MKQVHSVVDIIADQCTVACVVMPTTTTMIGEDLLFFNYRIR